MMAVFDESKVINALHTDRAEIGKKYYFSDTIYGLKEHVENGDTYYTGELTGTLDSMNPFARNKGSRWELIYPYEEPPKQRMTNRQLAEWLAKGNGECKHLSCNSLGISTCLAYLGESNDECLLDYRIRTWGSDEWVEPTVDIYERDCKGDK